MDLEQISWAKLGINGKRNVPPSQRNKNRSLLISRALSIGENRFAIRNPEKIQKNVKKKPRLVWGQNQKGENIERCPITI